MAEFVQQSIEEMLPELEQMQQAGILTTRETKLILKKRKAFEYRLRRKTKQKEDYLLYAQYEMNVLQLLHKRRKRIGYKENLSEIEVPIIQRIHKIFKMAYFRFPDDVKLFLSHIDFCKTKKQLTMVSKIYTTMLQVHNRKPALWVAAAKHEMESELSAMENARPLLQRGLRFNPQSKLLWRESGEDHVKDAVLEGAVAYIVFKQATDALPEDVEFWLSFLDVAQIFDFTHKLYEDMMTHIQFHHGNNESVLAAVAKQHLHQAEKVRQNKELKKKEISKQCVELEEKCYEAFDSAVKILPTERMYGLYLDTLLEKLDVKSTKHHHRRLSRTLRVFSKAAEVKCLSPTHAVRWCDVLEGSGQSERLDIAVTQITDMHPSCARAWHRRLSHCVSVHDSYQPTYDVFTEACARVQPQEQLSLWQLMYDWLRLCHPEHVQQFLQQGVMSKDRDVAVAAKIWSLEASALHGDMSLVRQTYKRLCTSQPLSLEFFNTYIELEKAQVRPKIKLIRSAYEDAVREYGSSSADLWLAYIKLELSTEQGSAENAGQLHWRAMKALDGHSLEVFTTQYALAQNGVISL